MPSERPQSLRLIDGVLIASLSKWESIDYVTLNIMDGDTIIATTDEILSTDKKLPLINGDFVKGFIKYHNDIYPKKTIFEVSVEFENGDIKLIDGYINCGLIGTSYLTNTEIISRLKAESIPDTGWVEKAKWRMENEDWLDISFTVAVRVQATLKKNERSDTLPRNRAELAMSMGCSNDEMMEILKGKENLSIETICKLQRILGIKLIAVMK